MRSKTPKIFIQSMDHNKEVSQEIPENITNLLTLRLINRLGDQYIVMSDIAMGSLLNQASLQLSGFGTKQGIENLKTIADFDVLISGTVARRANKYLLTLKVVKRSTRAEGFEILFTENLEAFPYQFDYYTEEISKKTQNPKYIVNSLNAPQKENLELTFLKIKTATVSSERLEAYVFGGGDSNARMLSDVLKERLLNADQLVAKKEYAEAAEIYLKSIQAVQSISEEYQKSLQDLLSLIRKNLDITYSRLFQEKLSKIDQALNLEKSISPESLNNYYLSYQNVLDEINSTTEFNQKIKTKEAVEYRIAEVKIASFRYMEKEADNSYQKLDFLRSHDIYHQIVKEAQVYLEPVMNQPNFAKILTRFEQKDITAANSARSYVNHTVNGLLEIAEMENARAVLEKSFDNGDFGDHFEKSVQYLEAAHAQLTIQEQFASPEIIEKYNLSTAHINENISNHRDYSLTNVLLLPFRYVGNLFKGVTDIFVFKFGYGIGAGTEVGPLGTSIGIAKVPLEFGTAYPNDSHSEISSVSRELKRRDTLRSANQPLAWGAGILGANTCSNALVLRLCDEDRRVYSGINFWVGVGPAFHLSIETHRLLEFLGVLVFQDPHIIEDQNERFLYFSFAKGKKFKKRKVVK
ncbi:hypothetical protein [Leptospira sarikeiensis]|uniref:Uncharacterized protein n=1 Tax=Leptospira sarikeiensis TaxID=2484943 RepID=A0A4R9K756_9LEPT|nr:hypothetical protein [Leptospira sarikeiensis]TGL60485.1 hypothetical protein EHQ64_11640 [Leptospira sarikeiensis]